MIESVPTRGRGSPIQYVLYVLTEAFRGHLHGASGCLHYLESLVVSLGSWFI